MRHRLVLLLALAGIVLWADPAAADRRIRPVDPSAPVRLALPGPGPYATYSAAALSPDGRRFAAAWQKDKVGVWDLAKNRLVVELSADDVVALQFSPGGDRLAVARLDRPTPQAPLV